MKDKLTIQLIDSILEWWRENKYNCYITTNASGYGIKHYIHTQIPIFVKLAKKLKRKLNDN